MKNSTAVLYPNEAVADAVSEYAENRSPELPERIKKYHMKILFEDERSIMMISTFQAQALIWFAKLIGAKRVLEIGVYVGFSSLVWSHAVGPEGHVTGLEYRPDYVRRAEEAFAANSVKNVEVICGDALEKLPSLCPAEPYDIIFIDAQKSGYPEYLSEILDQSKPGSKNRILRPGGLIIADNVLRWGLVADSSLANPHRAHMIEVRGQNEIWKNNEIEKLEEFNNAVHDSERLEGFLMPLWDGVGLVRLVD